MSEKDRIKENNKLLIPENQRFMEVRVPKRAEITRVNATNRTVIYCQNCLEALTEGLVRYSWTAENITIRAMHEHGRHSKRYAYLCPTCNDYLVDSFDIIVDSIN